MLIITLHCADLSMGYRYYIISIGHYYDIPSYGSKDGTYFLTVIFSHIGTLL